jgi:hypothetical protein
VRSVILREFTSFLPGETRERLTAVWLVTRGLHQDKPFLAHLQETIQLISDVIPDTIVFLGLIGMDVYTGVVVSQGPLAIFPRRDVICAHTINQPSASVLELYALIDDARFSGCPMVAEYGVRSYAGTALRFSFPRAEGLQEEVMLGTLCVVNFPPGHSLNEVQRRVLVRFANIIVYDIIERARTMRLAEHHAMNARLQALTLDATIGNAAAEVLAAAQETYSDSKVSLQQREDDAIVLCGWGTVPYCDFMDGLYEATAAVEAEILAANHEPLSGRSRDRTFRAIAAPCKGLPHTYLVVETGDLTRVFDEVDAAFVHSCALALGTAHQAGALGALETFGSGFSNELQVLVRSVLKSCDALVADAHGTRASCTPAGTSESPALIDNVLSASRALRNSASSLLNLSLSDPNGRTPPQETQGLRLL